MKVKSEFSKMDEAPSGFNGQTLEEDEEEDVFQIPAKNPTPQSLQRWRKATLVLNAARRFRYTAAIAPEQRANAHIMTLRSTTHALRALRVRDAIENFTLDPEKLLNLAKNHDMESLKAMGNVEGLMKMLEVDPDNGVKDDPEEIESRKSSYGANTYPRKPSKPLWAFALDACKDLTLIILIVCALTSLGLGIKTEDIKNGWYDGFRISVAVILVSMVSSVMVYCQSLFFLALNEEKRNIKVKVIRGGRRMEISIFDVVVGDIVVLDTGDQVPADGLFVSGHALQIDNSSITGESEAIGVHQRKPFLVSGGKVDGGHALMLVTGVGMATEWGQLMAAISEDSIEETPLQVRLNGVATLVGKVGSSVATVVHIISLIFHFVGNTQGSEGSAKFKAGQTSASDIFNSVIHVLVIAVRQRCLPLAVTLSLAYAMKKMILDKALVRRLSACETMGSATTICSDKTGTLTLNKMTVVRAWLSCGMREQVSDLKVINKSYYNVLMEGIVHNSNGSVFVPQGGGDAEVAGSATEKAILQWGISAGMDYRLVKSQSLVLQIEPFSSMTKQAGVAIKLKDSGKVHLHWKGAPEMILEDCNMLLDSSSGQMIHMKPDVREHLRRTIEGMASQSLRCIAFAYRQMDSDEVPVGDAVEEWKLPKGQLILLALIGMKDPTWPEVPAAVHQCQQAGIKVRMITGDNILTAKAIATECGILKEGDLVVEGATYRGYSAEMRLQLSPKIVVMARSTPSDKLLMVKTLRELGEVVAVTGDGIDDAPAIREADIGLTMGIQATEVTKESSDIVIMDDNFASVVKVVRWGRSVYLNIQKFIQFQLTINLAALTINFVATVASGSVPLTAVQLLWVNLIMDTLGALALATERPTDQLLERAPIGCKEPLISNVMWRNIFFQASYQVIILLVLQFKGEGLMEKLLKLSDSTRTDISSINTTTIFNAFVFCQVFNEVNSRKLEEINVFKGITTNYIFLGIIAFTILLQAIIVQFLNKFASTVKLDWQFWLLSILIGAVSWPLAVVVKFIPVPEKPIIQTSMNTMVTQQSPISNMNDI